MATKAEIIEQLEALSVEHDPTALKADLEALLPVASEVPTDISPVVGEQELDRITDIADEHSADGPQINVKSITTADASDNAEQTRLRAVFASYFEQNPDRVLWNDLKQDFINQIARAGVITE